MSKSKSQKNHIRTIASNNKVNRIKDNQFLSDNVKTMALLLQKHDNNLWNIVDTGIYKAEEHVHYGRKNTENYKITDIEILIPLTVSLELDDEAYISNTIKDVFPKLNLDYEPGETYIAIFTIANYGKFKYGVISPADNDGTHPEELEVQDHIIAMPDKW